MSYNLFSYVDTNEKNYAYLFLNGEELSYTRHDTYSQSNEVVSTGGRELILEVSAGDKIHIETTFLNGRYFQVITSQHLFWGKFGGSIDLLVHHRL